MVLTKLKRLWTDGSGATRVSFTYKEGEEAVYLTPTDDPAEFKVEIPLGSFDFEGSGYFSPANVLVEVFDNPGWNGVVLKAKPEKPIDNFHNAKLELYIRRSVQ